MKLTDKFYNFLKPLALIWLPGAATLYAAVAGIWGLPFVEQVVGTISAVDTFLGAGLHLSSKAYTTPSDGNLVVDKSDPTKDTYSLELTTALEAIEGKNAINLKVVPKT